MNAVVLWPIYVFICGPLMVCLAMNHSMIYGKGVMLALSLLCLLYQLVQRFNCGDLNMYIVQMIFETKVSSQVLG